MAKVIDLTESDGDLVVLGRSLVLPSSEQDSSPSPLNGALRFNPTAGRAQLFYAGAWITLGEGADSSGSSNNHTHTLTQILGLNTALAGKAPLVHTHAISDVTGLTTALATKSPLGHQHATSDITGLDTTLANKAALIHTHSYTVDEYISACLPGNPPALFKLVYTAPVTCTLPINLAGSFFRVGTNPAATFTITLYKNITTQVGTVTISPTGTVQIVFTAAVSLAAGDTLTFALPARDTAIDTISFTIVAPRPSQPTT